MNPYQDLSISITKVKKRFYILVLFTAFGWMASAQPIDLRIAQNNFDLFNYAESIQYYEEFLSRKDTSLKYMTAIHNLATAYRLNDETYKAAQWYEFYIENQDSLRIDPLDYFYAARMFQANEELGKAKEYMSIFLESNLNDSRVRDYAGFEVTKLEELLASASDYELAPLPFNTELDEFSPYVFKDSLIFVSNQALDWSVKRSYQWNQTPYLDLFAATKDWSGNWVTVKTFDKNLNTKYHEGPISMTADFSELYFTRNNYVDKKFETGDDGTNHLKVLYCKWKENKWSEPQELFFNSDEFSCGHPSISPEGDRLFFASDMPGGYGGTDIYYMVRFANLWSEPINCGPKINSSGNELFPFLNSDGTLYYASDGLFGLGGLDLFAAPPTKQKFGDPVNMGAPINSSKDDFGIWMNDDATEGYFSTNRDTAMRDDIYRFRLKPKLMLRVEIRDLETDSLIGNADLVIRPELAEADSILELDSLITWPNYAHELKVMPPNIPLAFSVKLEGYHDTTEVSTMTYRGVPRETQTMVLFLRPIREPEPEPKIVEPPKEIILLPADLDVVYSAGAKINIENIYFDFDKSNIRPDAAVELDKIVQVMKKYPDMIVECGSHTDSRGRDSYNQRLSQRRAESSVQYIISRGIEKERIYGTGYGETQIVNKCGNGVTCSDEEHQENRRTEFIVIQVGGDEELIQDEP